MTTRSIDCNDLKDIKDMPINLLLPYLIYHNICDQLATVPNDNRKIAMSNVKAADGETLQDVNLRYNRQTKRLQSKLFSDGKDAWVTVPRPESTESLRAKLMQARAAALEPSRSSPAPSHMSYHDDLSLDVAYDDETEEIEGGGLWMKKEIPGPSSPQLPKLSEKVNNWRKKQADVPQLQQPNEATSTRPNSGMWPSSADTSLRFFTSGHPTREPSPTDAKKSEPFQGTEGRK